MKDLRFTTTSHSITSKFQQILLAGVLFLVFQSISIRADPDNTLTNADKAGRIVEFSVPLSPAVANLNRNLIGPAKGGLALPSNFDRQKPCPLLIVSVPSGGSAVSWMRAVTNIALAEGWAVLGAEGPKVKVEEDSIQRGWLMLAAVLDYVSKSWPAVKQSPVACGGFSGGAKRSAAVAAALARSHYHVIGVFMGGCNEDDATQGFYAYQPGENFKNVPMFLSNGTQDTIAGLDYAAKVAASLQRTGFKTIRRETYDQGHRFDPEQLRMALRWFRTLEPASKP